MTVEDTFTCANCHQTFTKGWSDEEAQKEYIDSSHYLVDESTDVICDDCYEKFTAWFNKSYPTM